MLDGMTPISMLVDYKTVEKEVSGGCWGLVPDVKEQEVMMGAGFVSGQ